MNASQVWIERIHGALAALFIVALPLVAWAVFDGHLVLTRPADTDRGPTIIRLF
jgi:hypothetical protein